MFQAVITAPYSPESGRFSKRAQQLTGPPVSVAGGREQPGDNRGYPRTEAAW